MRYAMGQAAAELFDKLGEQITHAIRHDCFRYNQPCSECEENGHLMALDILRAVPSIRKMLATDVTATYEGDPAAKSHDEIIFSYPGILAITNPTGWRHNP
jgi:serine O-acetyltransferase